MEERIRRGEDAAAACESPMTPDAPPSADVSRGVLCCLVYVVPGVHRHAGVPAAAREGRGGVRVPLPRRCRHHPLDTKAFKYILVVMDRHRQGLVDDGTLPLPHLDWGLTGTRFFLFRRKLGPCLVHSEIQKLFKILRHIKSCGICMKH